VAVGGSFDVMARGIIDLLAVSRVEHGIISVRGNLMPHVVSMLVRIITIKNLILH
jgi:hypothetical protein